GPPISVETHAKLIRELAQRRTIMTTCRETEMAASDCRQNFRVAVAEHIGLATNIFDGVRERRTTYTIGEAGEDVIARLHLLRSGKPDPNAIPTGIACLDRMT